MARPKGVPKTGGRKKGVENKNTRDIKEAIRNLLESNLDNMTLWLKQIAADDPAKAMSLMKDLAEYCIPKLARTELQGDNKQQPPQTNITIKLADKFK